MTEIIIQSGLGDSLKDSFEKGIVCAKSTHSPVWVKLCRVPSGAHEDPLYNYRVTEKDTLAGLKAEYKRREALITAVPELRPIP